MRFTRRYPGFHHVAIAVQNRQLGSWQLLLSGDIGLADLHFGDVIFHLHLLDLGGILDSKRNAFRSHISVSRFCFNQCIGLAYCQFLNDMRFFLGYPFIHDLAGFINHLEFCSRQFFPGC